MVLYFLYCFNEIKSANGQQILADVARYCCIAGIKVYVMHALFLIHVSVTSCTE